MRKLQDALPAAAAAMGVDVESAGLTDPGWALPAAAGYVVVLVDGLGHQLLRDNVAETPFLASLLSEPGECGVPSTTATSITSLGTGLGAGQHGIVGYTSRIPGTERLLEPLHWDASVDPRAWQPHPTAFERLGSIGVATNVVSTGAYASSGLTAAAQSGARFRGADDSEARLAAAQALDPRSLTYYYDSDLDATGHRYGVDSFQWRIKLGDIDDEIERLRDALPDDVRLLILADHGMVDSADDHRVDIDAEPVLRDGVQLVGGEARFRHLYCRSGAVDDVVAAWSGFLGDRAVVLPRDDAIARGWFGDVAAAVSPRLGDVMVASLGDHAVMCSSVFPKELKLVGMHGSITRAEMEIPILIG